MPSVTPQQQPMPREGLEPRMGVLEMFSLREVAVLMGRKRMRPVLEEQGVEAAERVLVPMEPRPRTVSVQQRQQVAAMAVRVRLPAP